VVLPSNEAVLGAIEAGLGATLVSRSAVRARISAGTLAAVALPPERRSYDLVTRRERAPSRAAQAFLALCGAAAS
jgi:DNA-binding transcriptional LysR family regulator